MSIAVVSLFCLRGGIHKQSALRGGAGIVETIYTKKLFTNNHSEKGDRIVYCACYGKDADKM